MENRLSIQFVVWQNNSEKGEITLDLGYQGNMNIAFEMVLVPLKQTCLCWDRVVGKWKEGVFPTKDFFYSSKITWNF